MTIFLAIQNTYSHVQMSLMQDDTVLATAALSKLEASKRCIPVLQDLFDKNQISLNELAFIVANQGPGPFTTLRVVISTVNGLSFARKIPLIGVNALEAFLQEYTHQPYPALVAFLNAFSHDLYYGVKIGSTTEFGCGTARNILVNIGQKISQDKILFLGNGLEQFQSDIQNFFGPRAHFLTPSPETVSLHQIAKMGLERWTKQENVQYELQPIYLKTAFPA